MGRRIGAAIVGGFFGLVLGVGVGLYLSQTGAISMASSSSLAVPIAGVLVGLAAGLFGGRRRRAKY